MVCAKKQKKENKNMTTKKMAASIIAIMMVAVIFVTTAAAFTAPNANDDRVEFEYSEGNCDGLYVNNRTCGAMVDVTTLRIYGEDNVDAAFPYTDPEGPFDPTNSEAPGKDFVVFNPAYMPGDYLDGSIIVDTGNGVTNGREKVFVRQWYVPEYPEPRGKVWINQPQVASADIVTEYTYMLLDSLNMPVAGIPGTMHSTNFWLPIGSHISPWPEIGLTSFMVDPASGEDEMVELIEVGDFDGDGRKDINIATRDTICIDDDRPFPFWVRFMDHAIEVKGITATSPSNIYAVVDLYYLGNSAPDLMIEDMHLSVGGQTVVAGRHGYNNPGTPIFEMPWYLEVISAGYVSGDPSVCIQVGRLLHTNETFFVRGAEYDIAMIYGPEPDDQTFETFKYITIRNPIPKCIPGVQGDIELPVLTITKECVGQCDVMPMLPPFNMEHMMVDDINLPDCYTGCEGLACDNIHEDLTSVLDSTRMFEVDPLEIHWMKEDVEPRFHTNLLEILMEQTPEIWQWIHIHIMPENYTEMAYPPLPDAIVCDPPESLPGDFLLVSSWEAPNSCGDRMKFAHDADDPTDIYVNEQDECGKNSVRIYGEGDMDAAFPYTDPEGPFNKLSVDAPRKDFVTFNPAYMPGDYLDGSIIVDTGNGVTNGREKVFVRQWYVPEYPEPRGKVWINQPQVASADIVTEYTYMLLDSLNMPVAGIPGTMHSTNFWLPIGSHISPWPEIGLTSFMVDPASGEDEMVELIEVGDFDGDGRKDINIATRDTICIDDDRPFPFWVRFMDHAIEVKGITATSPSNIYAVVDLYYLGNSAPDLMIEDMHLSVGGQTVVAGRHGYNNPGTPIFEMPWYLEVISAGYVSGDPSVCIQVGRLLHTNETFFVRGAEYDIAMIYGPEPDDQTFETFKYITIRNPIPKCIPGVQGDIELPVLTITKECVGQCDVMPMLPPFNMDHTIVDDIGIPHTCPTDGNGDLIYGDYIQAEPGTNGRIDLCADEVAERIVTGQPAFVSYWHEEAVEERFRTNLLEILNESTTESWDMLCMWTLPWNYTAMVYPDVGDMLCDNEPIKDADFIVTTSGPALSTSVQKPDLVITAVTCPDGVEFSYTVANIGDAAAGAFDVSIEATGVSETDSLSGLAAGASATRTVAVDCVETGYTVCADSGGVVDERNEGNNCGVSGSCTCDWNPWNDDCDITNAEISNAEYYWYTNTPINGHIITNAEISMLEYQWVTGDVC